MSNRFNRRDFLLGGAGAGLAAAAAPRTLFGEVSGGSGAPSPARGQAPAVAAPRAVKPLVISSANGNVYKNGGEVTAVQKAFAMITQGADVLDALLAGVNILELDPEEDSVGYGGLPNADGVVQLDSSCMHGPLRRAGGVAALEGVRTPSLVAKAVMEQTDHHLLVGAGAQRLARQLGFKIEDDLNTEKSRRLWLEWKRRVDPSHFLDPKHRAEAGFGAALQMAREGLIDRRHLWGTINCNGINARGEICGVTTTSGLAWKIPGRVGDSPILGAGLYVDGAVGAAGSTGRGEANLYNLSSFAIVEAMRRGAHPKDAGMDALRRVAANTVERRLLDSAGRPTFDLEFYVLNHRGEHAAVSMYPTHYALCTDQGPETLPTDALYDHRQ
jgi:N4-(beta-N-acetylglucosaminyl)-L-asparaginase